MICCTFHGFVVSEVVLWQCWQTFLLVSGWELSGASCYFVLCPFIEWNVCRAVFCFSLLLFTLTTGEGALVSHCLLNYSRHPPNTCFVSYWNRLYTQCFWIWVVLAQFTTQVCLSPQGLEMRQIRFRFDGQPINETDTPAQVSGKPWNKECKLGETDRLEHASQPPTCIIAFANAS